LLHSDDGGENNDKILSREDEAVSIMLSGDDGKEESHCRSHPDGPCAKSRGADLALVGLLFRMGQLQEWNDIKGMISRGDNHEQNHATTSSLFLC
jgi:hypothetical protein